MGERCLAAHRGHRRATWSAPMLGGLLNNPAPPSPDYLQDTRPVLDGGLARSANERRPPRCPEAGRAAVRAARRAGLGRRCRVGPGGLVIDGHDQVRPVGRGEPADHADDEVAPGGDVTCSTRSPRSLHRSRPATGTTSGTADREHVGDSGPSDRWRECDSAHSIDHDALLHGTLVPPLMCHDRSPSIGATPTDRRPGR